MTDYSRGYQTSVHLETTSPGAKGNIPTTKTTQTQKEKNYGE